MAGEDAVRAAFAEQAAHCTRLGSPFMAALCSTLGERVDRATQTGRRVLDWPGNPSAFADSVPLRLTAGLHFLVRAGRAPGLARLYPPGSGDGDLWAEIAPVLDEEAETLFAFLANPPQTNDPGRSAVLMAGLLDLAARFPLPMRLYELGASAGLNLILDRYGYDLGGVRAGEPDSPLQLRPEWQGPPPPGARVRVSGRAGVDLRPADPVQDGAKLLAFVWPDQPERLRRLEAALEVAAANPPRIETGDAAEWLERTLPTSQAGTLRIVVHSMAFQYFPADAQRRIVGLLNETGAGAGEDAPLAWLRFEHVGGEAGVSLRLRTWPGEERLLAWAHPHGAWVEWLSEPRAR